MGVRHGGGDDTLTERRLFPIGRGQNPNFPQATDLGSRTGTP